MITQVPKDGFKNINYPTDRKSQDCKKVFLTRTPIGCCLKIIILLAWEKLDGFKNSTVTRKFKESGITEDEIYREVIRFIPEIVDWYSEQGSEFTPWIAWNRGHKGCAYDNDGVDNDPTRRGTLSDEHYTRSKALRPYAERIQKLWATKESITIADIEKGL